MGLRFFVERGKRDSVPQLAPENSIIGLTKSLVVRFYCIMGVYVSRKVVKFMKLFKNTSVKWELIGKTYSLALDKTTLILETEDKTRYKTIIVDGAEDDGLVGMLNWVEKYGARRFEVAGKPYIISQAIEVMPQANKPEHKPDRIKVKAVKNTISSIS